MKDIPIEELAAISPEIHEAALQVGCTHVNVTGKIWPGAQATGRPEQAARFVEFSWLRAAVVNGQPIFEEADPKAFAELLVEYGLQDAPSTLPEGDASKPEEPEDAEESASIEAKVVLTANVLLTTKLELERQARAAGISIGEFLDWKFRSPADQ